MHSASVRFHLDCFSPKKGDRLSKRDIVIVLSDGASTLGTDEVVYAASKLHQRGIRVFAIGIGRATRGDVVFINELKAIGTIVFKFTCILNFLVIDWQNPCI